MTVADHLDTLRTSVPGCTLTAYGDVSAKLVLRSSADTPWPQEKLDSLCRSAAQHFEIAQALAPFRSGSDRHREAVVATRQDVQIFVAAPEANGDLICCVCRSDVETGQVAHKARSTLSEIMDRG